MFGQSNVCSSASCLDNVCEILFATNMAVVHRQNRAGVCTLVMSTLIGKTIPLSLLSASVYISICRSSGGRAFDHFVRGMVNGVRTVVEL